MEPLIIVTIDGFAGSGKSTVAKKLAQVAKFIHLNSGLLYRALAFEVIRAGSSFEKDEVESLMEHLKFDFILDKGDFRTRITLNNRLLDEVALLSAEVGDGASRVGAIEKVREKLTKVQQNFAQCYSASEDEVANRKKGIVLEGRDAGTVVFPEAQYKFFLDATIEERARRRLLDEKKRGSKITFEQLVESIRLRDEADSNREFGPLKVAEGAEVILTDNKTVVDVVGQIFTNFSERL